MSFQPPDYEHRAYYVFHKTTGNIVYSHRFLTIRGDDSVLKKFNESSLLAAAAAHSSHPQSDLGIHLETGAPRHAGHISGFDVQAKALILSKQMESRSY